MELRGSRELKNVLFIEPHNLSGNEIDDIKRFLSPLESIEDKDVVYVVWIICGEKSDLFQGLEKYRMEIYPVETFAKLLKNYLEWLLERKENINLKLEKRTPYIDYGNNLVVKNEKEKNLPWIIIKEEKLNPYIHIRTLNTLNCLPFYKINIDDIEEFPYTQNLSKISHYEEIYREVKKEKNNNDLCFKILEKVNKRIVKEEGNEMYRTERFITNTNSTLSKILIVKECSISKLITKYKGKATYLFSRTYYEVS